MAKISDTLHDFDDSEYKPTILPETVTSTITPEEEKELTEDKRREEADDRDRDLEEGWTPGE